MKKYEGLKLTFYFVLMSILSFLLFKEIIVSSFLLLLASLSLFISLFGEKISKEKVGLTENVFELTRNPEKLLVYMMILLFLILLNSPRIRIFVAATPVVYTPETFSSTYVKISTFVLCDKVVIRANVSDSEGNQEATWMNLTDASNNLIYTNEQMTNTTESCGTNCWIWEITYTLKSTDPSGTWIINVTANDTAGNLGSNSTTFSVEAAPAGCNCVIRFLPYTATESNKIYCFNQDLYISGDDAIEFSSSAENSTLDCRGFNLDSDDSDIYKGIYIYLAKNVTVKNCNITDFGGEGIYVNGLNATLVNNTIYSNYYGIHVDSNYANITNNTVNSNTYGIYTYSDYNTIANNTVKDNIYDGIHISGENSVAKYNELSGNSDGIEADHISSGTITNNIIKNNDYHGILIDDSDNIVITNNTVENNGHGGIRLDPTSNYNTVENNIIRNNSDEGIYVWESNNNTFTNNTICGNEDYGIEVYSSSYNNITGGSIHDNLPSDFYLIDSNETNYFRNTNFTAARKIRLYYTRDWFNYNNASSDGIWLKTSFSTANTTTRELISWNQSLLEWNETAGPVTIRYNITGLKPSKTYEVFNNSQLVYALDTDSEGNLPSFTIYFPQNSEHNIKVQEVTGYLEVELVLPVPASTTKVDQNAAFAVNATVYCRGGNCGYVNGTVRYNLTSPNPDTPVNETSGDKPFYLNATLPAMKACPTNPLSENEFCNLTWSVVASGDFISYWKMGVLFNSSYSSVQDNHTDNATIEIVECYEGMNVGWNLIDFENLNPNTPGSDNPAPGNDNLQYNLTNTGTCNETLWIKGTDIKNSTLPPPNTIAVGNLTWSNSTNDYSNSFSMAYDYSLLYSNLTRSSVLTTYYWLAVPPVYAGKYEGNMTIGWNTTQQTG